MKLSITIFFILVLMVFVLGCATSVEPTESQSFKEEPPIAPSSPISVKLIVEPSTEKAKLGDETELIVSISSLDNNSYDGTTAQIDLPEGITLVSGDASWVGDLENPAGFNARIKFEEIGNWTVTASAKYIFSKNTWLGGRAQVCFYVSEDKIAMESGECPTQVILPQGIKELTTEPPQPFKEE